MEVRKTCLSKEREARESIEVCKPSGHALATSLVQMKKIRFQEAGVEMKKT